MVDTVPKTAFSPTVTRTSCRACLQIWAQNDALRHHDRSSVHLWMFLSSTFPHPAASAPSCGPVPAPSEKLFLCLYLCKYISPFLILLLVTQYGNIFPAYYWDLLLLSESVAGNCTQLMINLPAIIAVTCERSKGIIGEHCKRRIWKAYWWCSPPIFFF